MSEPTLYTTEEVKDLLKVSTRTLYRYIACGQIKALRLGRAYRFTAEALADFISSKTI